LSIPSQSASAPVGAPASQESTTTPETQAVAPVAPHAPTPQLVAVGAYASSTSPSQSSSCPLQVASVPVGVPASQESTTAPETQLVAPVAPHAPTPQLVAVGT
jgi:hypothetical protein